MAHTSVRTRKELEGIFVLAPERYDPRRGYLLTSNGHSGSVPFRKLALSFRRTVTAAEDGRCRCLVLDTSDAQEGIVVNRKAPITVQQIGSAKKVVEPSDVIISRLRPYLRQVAYVDKKIRHWAENVLLLCSTEFFVLRRMDEQSIAFLVPFLLSDPVQKVLAASQEGGHHPRVNESTLLGLPVPKSLIENRDALSLTVERSIELFRESEWNMVDLVENVEASFDGNSFSPENGIIDDDSDFNNEGTTQHSRQE